MNKRLKKKFEKRRREKILQVLDLVLQVNGLDQRKRESTGNLPTAFFGFSGHVASVAIEVLPEGWDNDDPYPRDRYDFYTDDNRFWQKAADAATELKKMLDSVKI